MEKESDLGFYSNDSLGKETGDLLDFAGAKDYDDDFEFKPTTAGTTTGFASKENNFLDKDEKDTDLFEKPLPAEPAKDLTADFLKSEKEFAVEKNIYEDDDVADDELMHELTKPSISPLPKEPSPIPPPIPKHREPLAKTDSSECYEPTQTPEPMYEFSKTNDEDEKFVETPTLPTTKFENVNEMEKSEPPKRKSSVESIGPRDIRKNIDAWFNPARLHPTVESLVYWRDPKKSGVVFGVLMLTLICLAYFSFISVVAYLCLTTVLATTSFRVYKSLMQAVQKTSDGHPFKQFLDIDLTIPEEKVAELSQLMVKYINTGVKTLRSLFLVEDLIDTIKFALLLWVLTYVGACFNGLTLIIIGVVLMFSMPKIYENNQAQIDVYVKIAMDKLSIVTNKMKAVIPETKKEN